MFKFESTISPSSGRNAIQQIQATRRSGAVPNTSPIPSAHCKLNRCDLQEEGRVRGAEEPRGGIADFAESLGRAQRWLRICGAALVKGTPHCWRSPSSVHFPAVTADTAERPPQRRHREERLLHRPDPPGRQGLV